MSEQMTDNKPSFALHCFEIKNFKGIKSLKVDNLPANAPWIFLTGENGYGKTCVLQGLAIALTNDVEEHTKPYMEEGSMFWLKYHENQNNLLLTIPDESGRVTFKWLACYGSSRLDTYAESSTREKSLTSSLFDSRTLLENIELKLSRWYFKKDVDPEYETKYKTVVALFKELLNLQDITVDKKTDKMLYTEKAPDGKIYSPLPSEQLASGYRSIIYMVGDMILKLFDTQPEVWDPKNLKGIVIIDELDLHFHPKWQKRLPRLLSKIFPRIQFIASTHSPIPVLGAPGHSVFLKVNRSRSEGITIERLGSVEKQLPDLLPNTLLSSPLFGFQDIFAATHSKNKPVRTEDSYPEIIVNDTLRKRLKKFKNSDLEKKLKNTLKSV
jgi:predicted ATP-binding protein involved in virulence